ncbi:hypothetical protein HDU85_004888 [Gaertneriomyces sp. JEL0708]|nr:hypothetical protein HDU85_004888 [Gaertneriomyces sp. JEL0708]
METESLLNVHVPIGGDAVESVPESRKRSVDGVLEDSEGDGRAHQEYQVKRLRPTNEDDADNAEQGLFENGTANLLSGADILQLDERQQSMDSIDSMDMEGLKAGPHSTLETEPDTMNGSSHYPAQMDLKGETAGNGMSSSLETEGALSLELGLDHGPDLSLPASPQHPADPKSEERSQDVHLVGQQEAMPLHPTAQQHPPVEHAHHIQQVPPAQPAYPAQQAPPTPQPLQSTHQQHAAPLSALARDQLKYCASVVRQLKRLKDARPFLEPVDPVKLNIPTYFDVVKHPMDISTIDRKLRTEAYSGPEEFIADVQLMFANCYAFNGKESPVGQNGVNLERAFGKHMEKLPTTARGEKGKKASIVASPGDYGRRESVDSNRPRREIHPPVKDLPHGGVLGANKRAADPELKFCGEVLRELHKKHHYMYSTPFLQPVDPIALNIPHYFDIIKHPMDLSTVKKKLDLGQYQSADEFRADVKLMFNNCYTFNPPGTDVHNAGRQLEEVFDRKWREKSQASSSPARRSQRPPKPKSRSNSMHQARHDYTSSEEEDSSDDDDTQQLRLLQQQLQAITSQMQMLQEKRSRKKEKKRKSLPKVVPAPAAHKAARTPKTPKTPKQSGSAKKGGPKRSAEKSKSKKRVEYSSDEEEDDLSYEQKSELSHLVNELPMEKIDQVMEIIRTSSGLPETSEGGEIELDIEALPKPTLWKLYKFVKGHSSKGRKASYQKQGSAQGPVGLSGGHDSSSSDEQSDSGSGDSGDDD